VGIQKYTHIRNVKYDVLDEPSRLNPTQSLFETVTFIEVPNPIANADAVRNLKLEH